MKRFEIKFIKSGKIFESDGECFLEVFDKVNGRGCVWEFSMDNMKRLVEVGRVKEYVKRLIVDEFLKNESVDSLPQYSSRETSVQTCLPVFTPV